MYGKNREVDSEVLASKAEIKGKLVVALAILEPLSEEEEYEGSAKLEKEVAKAFASLNAALEILEKEVDEDIKLLVEEDEEDEEDEEVDEDEE